MSKLFDLLQGKQKQNGGIFPAPVPELEIIFTSDNGRSVIVEGVKPLPPHDIVEFVQREKGGKWMFGIWANGEWQRDNPYQNGYGLWDWLLVKE